MTTTLGPDTELELTADDRVLLHAIALAGDAVHEPEIAYLLERWPWASPMGLERVDELADAGMLQQADHGWFVPLAVDRVASATLPAVLEPMLKGFVGEMLCRHADSFERFQLGFRRMLAGGREHAIVSVSRAWAENPASANGPRGQRFVDALGAKRLGPVLAESLRDAVPELARARADWLAPIRAIRARLVPPQPAFAPARATVASAA